MASARRSPPAHATPPARRSLAPLAAAALALIGLAFSAALLVDSLRPEPAFCAAEGCGAVRATAWARPLGVPMPLFGAAFFASALGLIAAGPRAARARQALAAAGGVGALGLIAVQAFVIGHWCALCLVVDGAALAHAVVVLGARGREWPRARPRGVVAVSALAVAAVALPFARFSPSGGERLMTVSATTLAELPPPIAREQRAGTVAVIDFIDFECPHCRAFHQRLVEAMARARVPVRVVRKMVPLPQHRGAVPAAIAWSCADAQGRGDEMAEALLSAPPSRLTPAGCEEIAAELGLDLDRYRRDAAHPSTRSRLAADMADARAVGLRALPTVFIGRQLFTGAAASVDDLVAALRRAAGGA